MGYYQLHAKQGLSITKAKAWDFLTDPENLSLIAPEGMRFENLSSTSIPMFVGKIFQYKVSPFPGYKTRWVTAITHLKSGDYFVDEQRFGPYALWQHKHFLKPCKNGVIMEDIINYKLPLGILGHAFFGAIVRKQLQKVFQFRYEKLKSLFGEIPGIEPTIKFTNV